MALLKLKVYLQRKAQDQMDFTELKKTKQTNKKSLHVVILFHQIERTQTLLNSVWKAIKMLVFKMDNDTHRKRELSFF